MDSIKAADSMRRLLSASLAGSRALAAYANRWAAKQKVIMIRRITRFLLLICLFGGLYLLVACQSNLPLVQASTLEIGDGGFLSEKPCGPPCFWNINPDITTQEQVIKIFQDNFDIKNCREFPTSINTTKNDLEIVCNPVVIYFDSSRKVDYIRYSPLQSITVKDVIAKYGEPNAVGIEGFSSGGNNTPTESVVMTLFFDGIRSEVELPEQNGMNYYIESSIQIVQISYPGNSEWETGLTNPVQPWLGFGNYEGPYWAGP